MKRKFKKVIFSLLVAHLFLQLSLLKLPSLSQILNIEYIAYRFLSLFFLLGFYCVFIALFASFEKGDFFFKVFFILLAFTNSLKMLYRQEPIIPYDLQFLKTPFSFFTMVNAFYLLLFAVFFILVYIWIHKTYQKLDQGLKVKMILKKRLMMIAVAAAIFTTFLQISQIEANEFENENNIYFYQDDPVQIYEEKGFVMGFASNLPGTKMRRPQNYSKAKVFNVMKKYEKEAAAINTNRSKEDFDDISIVFVLSESLSDPNRVHEVEILSANPLSYIQNPSDKLEYGTMMSPVYGGGTANTEFEVLTGFSTQFLNSSMSIPYLSFLPDMEYFPSFVEFYRSKDDKEAIAMHAYHSGMFHRREVYDLFSFDQQIYQDSFKHKEKIAKSDYISDRSAYQEVLDILRRNDEKDYFIHLVTMQNHAKYSDKYEAYHFDVKAPLSRKTQDQIRYYTEGIYETDQATRDFVKALDDLDRKVLLVFYGDHLPSLYYDLKDQNDLWSLSMTDYFILSNFNLGKEKASKEAISPIAFVPKILEYADVKISPYQALLMSYIEHIPYAKAGCFYNHEKQARAYESLSEEEKELIHDYYLIQYDMIEGNQYARSYFNQRQ